LLLPQHKDKFLQQRVFILYSNNFTRGYTRGYRCRLPYYIVANLPCKYKKVWTKM